MEFTNEELTAKALEMDSKFEELTEKMLTLENDIQHLDARIKTLEADMPNKANCAEMVWRHEKIKELIRELANLVKEDIKLKEEKYE